jgi:peptidoglycan/LPS O-acetylase OafA/YrhL
MEAKFASSDHYAVLDGLRGFAAIAVVMFHLGHWLNIPGLATNSFLAVEFFFCLSGYVLAKAYGHGKHGLGALGFIRVRLIRLMPLVAAATIVSACYAGCRLAVTHDLHLLPSLGLAAVLGLLNLPYLGAPSPIGGPQVFPLKGPQYTLFLELAANFAWFPIRIHRPLATAAVIAASCWLLIVIFGAGGGDTTANFWRGFPRVGASFFAGVALFELQRRYQIAVKIRGLFWPLIILMVALFFYPKTLGNPVQLAWIGLVSPLLVLSGLAISTAGATRRLCLAAGALSYPIYVLQYPIFCWVNGGLRMVLHHRNPVLGAPLILIAICVLSAAAAIWFDNPVRQALGSRPPASQRPL